MSGEHEVRANGVDLCLETFGSPRDPTVLLIHGAQASMLWWEEELCEAIAAGGRHVIRYDNRDTGCSVSYPPGQPGYAMSDLAADAVGILDALAVERAHIVGRSMAGGIALFLGVDHPERVESLTLVTTTSGADDLPGMDPDFVGQRPIPAADDADGLVGYIVESIRNCAGHSPYFDADAVRARARRDVARSHSIVAALTNHWLMTLDSPQHGEWSDISVPTLVVEGDLDPYFPPPHGAVLAAAVPGARLLTLDQVGHDVPRPVWGQFVSALLAHTSDGG